VKTRIALRFVLLFFFQAEDGIRDLYVTGVQTCALPILRMSENGIQLKRLVPDWLHSANPSPAAMPRIVLSLWMACAGSITGTARSEERRVGKECRCRWWR